MTRDQRVQLAKVIWGGFYRCPTTGRILEQLPGDDKVLCSCGTSNPRCPTEHPGVHVVRFLEQTTAEAYIDEFDRRTT